MRKSKERKKIRKKNTRTLILRPYLDCLGYPRQPSPRVTLTEVSFSIFLCEIQLNVYTNVLKLSRGGRDNKGGRVVSADGGTVFTYKRSIQLPQGEGSVGYPV